MTNIIQLINDITTVHNVRMGYTAREALETVVDPIHALECLDKAIGAPKSICTEFVEERSYKASFDGAYLCGRCGRRRSAHPIERLPTQEPDNMTEDGRLIVKTENAAVPETMTHDLKTWPEYYRAIVEGRKNFELRRNDRGFKVGDRLILREWIPSEGIYTGEWCEKRISYMTQGVFGLPEDIAILSLSVPPLPEGTATPEPMEYRYKTSEEAELLPLGHQILRLKEINSQLCHSHNTLLIENARLEREAKSLPPLPEGVGQPTDDVYQVHPDPANACTHCSAGMMFDVVFMPTETALGITYGNREEAEEMAEELNDAYSAGRLSMQAKVEELSTRCNQLTEAIKWANGEYDFRERGPKEGAYWWRKELTQRAFGDPTRCKEFGGWEMSGFYFNRLEPDELERLSILGEELGEAQQSIGKILRHGYDSCNPDLETDDERAPDNRESLERELGDVMCAINMMFAAEDIDRRVLERRASEKSLKIRKYLHHQR